LLPFHFHFIHSAPDPSDKIFVYFEDYILIFHPVNASVKIWDIERCEELSSYEPAPAKPKPALKPAPAAPKPV
jgi:hypothetical protein